MKRLRKRLLIAGSVAVMIVGVAAYVVFRLPNTFGEPKGKVVFIPRGVSFRAAVDSLNKGGVIRSPFLFSLAGRILGYTKTIKVGKYLFTSGLSNVEILKDIRDGKSRVIVSVSIPEGWREETIAHKFARELGLDARKFLAICNDSAFIHNHGIDAASLEGYLYPDTYNFYWQTDEQEVVDRMLVGFQTMYADSLKRRQDRLGLTLNEVLTMASIVESESSIPEERSVIAGVYWNRLKKRMRLEADPTVQFALGEFRRLREKDLRVDSPYNTYLHYGLPPAPINNPGKSSIVAALFPEKHSYLYFVATGLGGHHFSKSFAEHRKAIRDYHRIRRTMRELQQASASPQ